MLTSYRERCVLRRLRTTPAQPSALLVAHVVVNLVSAVLASLLAVAVAPSASAGQMLGTLLWFPIMFLAGLWVPAVLRDDGVGFEPAAAGRIRQGPNGFGVAGMRERVERLAGIFRGRVGRGGGHRRVGQGAGRGGTWWLTRPAPSAC